jgi:hypothetical protein
LSQVLLPGREGKIFATLMLWKKSGEKWTNQELAPVKKIQTNLAEKNITVFFTNNSAKTISYIK